MLRASIRYGTRVARYGHARSLTSKGWCGLGGGYGRLGIGRSLLSVELGGGGVRRALSTEQGVALSVMGDRITIKNVGTGGIGNVVKFENGAEGKSGMSF